MFDVDKFNCYVTIKFPDRKQHIMCDFRYNAASTRKPSVKIVWFIQVTTQFGTFEKFLI